MPKPSESQLINGHLLDLLNPDPSIITAGLIANSLWRIPRFLGHTTRPWNVLQHCMLCVRLGQADRRHPEELAQIALHDAHEAFVGDLPSPVKGALAEVDSTFPAIWDSLTHPIDIAISEALGVPLSDTACVYDFEALCIERAAFMPRNIAWELPSTGGAEFAYAIKQTERDTLISDFKRIIVEGRRPLHVH